MSVFRSRAWKILRTSYWFVLANAFAGVFNYLYQVLASKELSAAAFSELNAWYSELAVFFLISGLLQYAANFIPLAQSKTRLITLALNVLALALAVVWLLGPAGQTFERAIIVVLGAAIIGWMTGQVQSRLLFTSMTIAGLLIGTLKVAFTFVPFESAIERYTLALFLCYLPALWWMSVRVWMTKAPELPRRELTSLKLWAAPLILSTAGAVIPQIDMIIMSRIQAPEVFQDFAHASLFYKGIYFLLFIVAQWLLPQQIRANENASQSKENWVPFALLAFATSAALAFTSPWIVEFFLHWTHAPPRDMVFLSCLNISLLTWVFFEIQGACSRYKQELIAPAFAVLALGLEALLQWRIGMTPTLYLVAACVTQSLIITALRTVKL